MSYLEKKLVLKKCDEYANFIRSISYLLKFDRNELLIGILEIKAMIGHTL